MYLLVLHYEVRNVGYYDYINSREWKDKSRKFKQKTGGICQVFPWKKATISHHTTYENKGHEVWNIDCIVLSKSAHKLIHGWAAFSNKDIGVSQQNRNSINIYPNILQRMIHWYARIVGIVLFLIKFN